jgi:NTP pyrophosphatase (non-canonical NTP hydrolase)
VHENAPGDQLEHILSEIKEIQEAVEENYEDLEEACKDEHVEEELADLYGSLETYWHIKTKQRGPDYIEALFARVEAKNRARGYYDTPVPPAAPQEQSR